MRDLFLASVFVLLLLRTFRHAETGAHLWAWLSLMNPHKLTYGFAYSVPWAYMTAIVTLVCFPFSKSKRPLPMNGGVILLLLLWFWMTVTSVVSINPSEMVWDRWIFVSKIYLMLLVTVMLVRSRKQIDVLIWVVVISIGFFGFKGGVFTVATGGSYRVWGPPDSMVEENNALAVALMIVLPLMYYLRLTSSTKWVRWLMSAAMLFCGVSVLGSQSRGAFLALLAMAFVLGAKSKHPVRFSLVLAMVLSLGVAFMPDSWTERMDTIQNYSGDTSAMSRLYTWETLWNAAKDRPLVGAGFRADTIDLFNRYAPVDEKYSSVAGTAWVAHSIYFQALGEHGFVGLFLFLAVWAWVWIAGGRLAKRAQRIAEFSAWMPLLLRMCQVSTVGFCAGGAFLSLMLLDLPYYIVAFVTLCQCELDEFERRPSVQVPGVQAPPARGAALA